MAGVDDAIVEMKFDNLLFEKKLNETIQSLDKLRASLDFTNAKKGLTDLASAGKNFNMNAMGSSIEDISRKFLAMSTIAITALSNITNKAVNAGLQMAKAFTVGPIIAGFQEMETNMNSIQTILANTESKGTTLEDVNAALQQLNEYSDKTIYNFAQMAKNIGTFTAAGVDLDTSVDSIKGIANLAALSGSSAEQASGAMYQLSQAIATGSLKLIDWNSVVNAGMGGEVFKTALFETAKAAGTLTDVPVGQTFKEWEEANGSFRESLQDGWVTSEVLTTTLSTFTGDLSDAELRAKGFTDAQIANIKKLAATATGAATEVKTFTQLVGTVKESIATGFADSFKLIIGNFNEAKELFTSINNVIGGFVGRVADARNELILGWRFLGGRERLLQGLEDAFMSIGKVIGAVSKAFRTIFPKTTAEGLTQMTIGFANFTAKMEVLIMKYLPTITKLFTGLFAGVEIVMTIFKEFGKTIFSVFEAIGGKAGGPALGFLDKIASGLIAMNEALVEGGGIVAFFDKIREAIKNPAEAIEILTEAIDKFFDSFAGGKGVSDSLDAVGGRFEHLQSAFRKVGDAFDWIIEKTEGIRQVLGDLWNYITQFFRELGDSMKSEMEQADFEGALDIFNVAILGGIAVMLRKFFKNGFDFDIGGGFLDKMNTMFGELTGTLKAMQTELKAKALMEIAIAMGVLTLSLVALSLIDSADLTKALTAMAVGFAELIGAMVAIDTLMSTFSGAKFLIVAGGMVLLSGAMILLAGAMKIMATMSWEEIAKGLAGVAGGLTALVTAISFITADTAGLVKAGLSMIVISVGLRILANAMQAFATMGWQEIGKGMASVAGGLVLLVTAMNSIDAKDMIQAGLGIIAISVGMRIMANAMQAFATMSWEEMAKGLIAVGGALAIIVLLTNTMPAGGMIGIGAGLILVSVALNLIAQAVQSMGGMNMETLGKGLLALGVSLLFIVAATNAMTGALPGAAAMLIVAGALYAISEVIGTLGEMKTADLIKGMVALAAIFVVLGVAAYFMASVVPALLGLGAALALIGVGMAAFGVGAYLTIKAFELLGKVGPESMMALIDMIAIFVARAPLIGIAIASILVAAVTDLAEAAPALVKALKVVLLELLEAVKELAPEIGSTIMVLMDTVLKVIDEQTPKIIEAGWNILLSFAKGIRDNIEEFVTVVSDIVENFLDAFADEIPDLVDSLVNLLSTAFTEVARGLGELMPTLMIGIGISFMEGFWTGITTQLGRLGELITQVINDIIGWFKDGFGIFSPSTVMMDIGVNIIKGLWEGLQSLVGILQTWFVEFPLKVLNWIGDTTRTLFGKGVSLITGLLTGLAEKVLSIASWFGELPGKVLGWLGDVSETLVNKGYLFITGLLDGLRDKVVDVKDWFLDLPGKIIGWIGDAADWLFDAGKDVVKGLWEGIKSMKDWLADKAETFAGWVTNPFGMAMEILSPSKVFARFGVNIGEGLIVGMESMSSQIQKASASMAQDTKKSWEKADFSVLTTLPEFGDMNPVITPVIDLTEVKLGAKKIDAMMAASSISAEVSIERARALAVVSDSQNGSQEVEPITPVVEQHVTFEQNNYSPKALNAHDIYRNGRSQIELAKEELKIA